MYDDKEVTYKIGVNWKDVIIKIILLILFIVLLIWIFPNPQLDTFYDGIFNDNIQTMKEAAKSYYTVDRLPENIGDSNKMTLQEMIDNHMIIEFVDKDNKTCNGNDSYVQVTKTGDNDYVLKVQLSCDGKTDYILETIGCYDVCPNGNCNPVVDNQNDEVAENITQYQFKQAIDSNVTTYTCPSGYTKKGSKCYKAGTTETINATATYFGDSTGVVSAKKNTSGSYIIYADPLTKAGALTCPTGYTSNGTQCVKVYNASSSTTSGLYTCPSGYTLSGTMCYKTYAATYNNGSSSYTCPYGYTRSGTTCYKSYNATYTSGGSSYYCPYGTRIGSNCYYNASYRSGSTSTSCPSGWSRSGNQCYTRASYTGDKINYTCPNGGSLNSNHQCVTSAKAKTSYGSWYLVKTYKVTRKEPDYNTGIEKKKLISVKSEYVCQETSKCPNKALHYTYSLWRRRTNTSYSCSYGSPSGSKCVYAASKKVTSGTHYCSTGDLRNGYCYISAKTTGSSGSYYCPNGGNVNSNHQCVYSASKSNGSGSYSCPNGGTPNGSTCVITTTATKQSSNGAYTCSEGGTLNGTVCRINKKATKGNGSTVFTCPYGGSLNGAKCTTYTDGYAQKAYYCPEGYTTSGSGASMTCSKKVNGSNKYYCEDANAKLNGDKCIITIKGSVSGYTCPSGYTKKGSKCTRTNTITINATASTTTTKSYKYTWSESQTLDGWIATGKTRTISKTTDIK